MRNQSVNRSIDWLTLFLYIILVGMGWMTIYSASLPVEGASVFDLPSWYLSISKNWGDSEIWRFESQQWRMSKSLYEDREGYERNSPSTWVENVTMPVLIWTGDKDPQINPNQSIAFYLALRRLNKKVVFLNYSNESHSLLKKESQVDLYNRFNDWLGYHLKEQPPAEWIIRGLK